MENKPAHIWSLTPSDEEGVAILRLEGDWVRPASLEPPIDGLRKVIVSTESLGAWNAFLATALHHLKRRCESEGIELDLSRLPDGVRKLLKLDGGRIQMQAFDHEFTATIGTIVDVKVLGRCVKLLRTL